LVRRNKFGVWAMTQEKDTFRILVVDDEADSLAVLL
jgi:hypothetical protein